MPAHDHYVNRHSLSAEQENMLSAIAGHRNTDDHLLDEVRGLRSDIAALRAALEPVPSLIVTGREALDAFKRLAIFKDAP